MGTRAVPFWSYMVPFGTDMGSYMGFLGGGLSPIKGGPKMGGQKFWILKSSKKDGLNDHII